MKKFLLLLLILPLCISCSKDDEDEDQQTNDFELDSLSGTIWENKEKERTEIFTFHKDDFCTLNNSSDSFELAFLYVYQPPEVHLTRIDGMVYLKCTISKKKLSLINISTEEIISTFTLKE